MWNSQNQLTDFPRLNLQFQSLVKELNFFIFSHLYWVSVRHLFISNCMSLCLINSDVFQDNGLFHCLVFLLSGINLMSWVTDRYPSHLLIGASISVVMLIWTFLCELWPFRLIWCIQVTSRSMRVMFHYQEVTCFSRIRVCFILRRDWGPFVSPV